MSENVKVHDTIYLPREYPEGQIIDSRSNGVTSVVTYILILDSTQKTSFL